MRRQCHPVPELSNSGEAQQTLTLNFIHFLLEKAMLMKTLGLKILLFA